MLRSIPILSFFLFTSYTFACIGNLPCQIFLQNSSEQNKISSLPSWSKLTPKHQKELEHDIRSGDDAAETIDQQLKFSEDKELIQRVEQIGAKLAKIAQTQKVKVLVGDEVVNPFPYIFKVVKGDDVNAFSLAGGRIYVYEGLATFAENDDELAAVLAHEISHVASRHVYHMVKKQQKINLLTLPALIAGALIGNPMIAGLAQAGSLTGQAIVSNWSQDMEMSADYGGLQYLIKSPYNPLAMFTFQERLVYRNRFNPEMDWGIYQTHPPSVERAKATYQRLTESKIHLSRSKLSPTLKVCLKKISPTMIELTFLDQKIHMFGGPNAEQRANIALEKINLFLDQSPKLFEAYLLEKNILKGKNECLFEVTLSDAEVQQKSLPDTAQEALKGIKTAIYNLTFHIIDVSSYR